MPIKYFLLLALTLTAFIYMCSCSFATERFYVSPICIHLCPCRSAGSGMVLDASGKNCLPPPHFVLPGCKIQDWMREEKDADISPQQCFITAHFQNLIPHFSFCIVIVNEAASGLIYSISNLC